MQLRVHVETITVATTSSRSTHLISGACIWPLLLCSTLTDGCVDFYIAKPEYVGGWSRRFWCYPPILHYNTPIQACNHPWAYHFIVFGSAWESNLSNGAVRQYLERLLGAEFLMRPNVQPVLEIVTSPARHNRSLHNDEFINRVAHICSAAPIDVRRVFRIASAADELAKLERLVELKIAGLHGRFANQGWDLIVEWLRSKTADCTELRLQLKDFIGSDIARYPWSAAVQLCLLSQQTSQSRLYTLIAVLKLRVEESDERRKQQALNDSAIVRRPSTKEHATSSSKRKKSAKSFTPANQRVDATATSAGAHLNSLHKQYITHHCSSLHSLRTDQLESSRTPTPLPTHFQHIPTPDQLVSDQSMVTFATATGHSMISDEFSTYFTESGPAMSSVGSVFPSVAREFDAVETRLSSTMSDSAHPGLQVTPTAISQLDRAFMTDLYAYGSIDDYGSAPGGLVLESAFEYSPMDPLSRLIGLHSGDSVNAFPVGADGRAVDVVGSGALNTFSSIESTPPTVDVNTLHAVSDYGAFDCNTTPTWMPFDALAPYVASPPRAPLHDFSMLFSSTISAPLANGVTSIDSAMPISTIEDQGNLRLSATEPLVAHENIDDALYGVPGAADDEPPPLVPEPGHDDEEDFCDHIPDPNPAICSLVGSVLQKDGVMVTRRKLLCTCLTVL